MRIGKKRYDVKAYLQLIRAPGIFSIVSNVFASTLIFHWLNDDSQLFFLTDFLVLLTISICCYQVGMITNDVADIDEDLIDRPFRPITSGRILKSSAITLSIAFSVIALGVAASYSWSLLGGTFVLLIAIISYNFLTKASLFGSINMAGIRLLNWMLVASLYSQLTLPYLTICLMVFFYTLLVTVISRFETTDFPPKIKIILYIIVLLMFIVWGFSLKLSSFTLEASGLLVVFLCWLAVTIYKFSMKNKNDIQQWVTTLLKSMVVLDALLLFSCGLFFYAIVCLSLLLLSKKTAQYVYLT